MEAKVMEVTVRNLAIRAAGSMAPALCLEHLLDTEDSPFSDRFLWGLV